MTLADLGIGFLQSWINFGVVSIASAQVALLVTYVRLPLIIGYMFFGLIAGPQVTNLVTSDDIPHLLYITQFALSFICLSAGAELYLPELKSLFRRILTLTGLITVITFVLVVIVVYLESVGGLASYTSQLPSVGIGSCEFSIALIAAAIMVSQSPASAIAVVREVRAKGPFTSTMLGVTVLIDVVVLLLAVHSHLVSANSECDPSTARASAMIDLVLTLGDGGAVRCSMGWVVGKVIIFLHLAAARAGRVGGAVAGLRRVPIQHLVPRVHHSTCGATESTSTRCSSALHGRLRGGQPERATDASSSASSTRPAPSSSFPSSR